MSTFSLLVFDAGLSIPSSLDQMMAVTSLTLKTDTYFGLVIPWTEASDIVKHAAQMFKAAEGDFTVRTFLSLMFQHVDLFFTCTAHK